MGMIRSISKAHLITFYVLLVIVIMLFVFWLISIWKRKKRNIAIVTFLMIIFSWYFGGLNYRLRFFDDITCLVSTLGFSARAYYSKTNELPSDITSLFSDDNVLFVLTNPYRVLGIPKLGVKLKENETKYSLQIYWYGFDGDDDELKDYRFPGWFRLIYFPWGYDGDVFIGEVFFDKDYYKKRKEKEKELSVVKSALKLRDAITEYELDFFKELKKDPRVEVNINRVYDAVIKVFRKTYGKELREEELNSYLEEIKKLNYPDM